MTTIIAAFPGTGKTFLCATTNIKAVEIEYWKYKDKGLQNRYIKDIKKHLGTVEYIFIATDPEGLRLLYNEGLKITLVYPRIDLRNEYLDRYIRRSDSVDFIGAFMKYWEPWINELIHNEDHTHIILHSGEYLIDVINKLKK